jgi:hypothetical protein
MMTGFTREAINNLASRLYINVCSPAEYAGLANLAQQQKTGLYTDVKTSGSPVPTPAMHSLVLFGDELNDGHCVLVTSRALSRAYEKVVKSHLAGAPLPRVAFASIRPDLQNEAVAATVAMTYNFGRNVAAERFRKQDSDKRRAQAEMVLRALKNKKLALRAVNPKAMALEVNALLAATATAKSGTGYLAANASYNFANGQFMYT